MRVLSFFAIVAGLLLLAGYWKYGSVFRDIGRELGGDWSQVRDVETMYRVATVAGGLGIVLVIAGAVGIASSFIRRDGDAKKLPQENRQV